MSDPNSHYSLTFSALSTLLDADEAAVISLWAEGTIKECSPSAERLFGFTQKEVVGANLLSLLAVEAHDSIRSLLTQVLHGKTVSWDEMVWLHKSGRSVHVVLSAAPLAGADASIQGIVLVLRDTGHRRKKQNELAQLQMSAQHRNIVLEAANRVALDILSSRSGLEALRHIAEAARVLGEARYAALGVACPDGNGLSEFITVGLTPNEESAIGSRPRGAGVLGLLLKRTKPLRIDVLSQHPASVGFPPNHPPMDSFLGVPIRRGDAVVGSLYLTNKQGGGPFTSSDEVAVEALGAHAAVAIHNLHMLLRQRRLVSGLIAAQEEERRAIAYDLHDGLTQFVMASHAHLEAYKRAQKSGNEERATRELGLSSQYLGEAVVESRRLVNGLRLLALDDLGLQGALHQLVIEEAARAGWREVDWNCNLESNRFDRDLETTVYRVAQEALTNARKYADAERVQVSLLLEPGETSRLVLEVRDWGKGFNWEDSAGDSSRVGLQSMAERVNLLGGHFQLESALGNGASIRAIFTASPISKGSWEDH